jgi:hypothetical protein
MFYPLSGKLNFPIVCVFTVQGGIKYTTVLQVINCKEESRAAEDCDATPDKINCFVVR